MSKKVKIHQIQSLRALAALLVVIFHADWLPGGFIGVDIFYVISGYLITGLILKEIEREKSFLFKAFYIRRAKRLLPASLGILALTAVFSWLILPPTVRAALARDTIAVSLYISNYLFAWWETDYQNLNATPSPLIHYWSLAVEEQFYLFWPIIVYFLWKNGGRKIVGIGLVAITISSFLFSIYLTSTNPIWAFYSLPTRAWELGIGALILFLPKQIEKISYVRRSTLAWLGFTLLLIAIFSFNKATPFPSYYALLPTLGTALMIAFISGWAPLLNDFSRLKIIQWLGQISYPFYLWHWPLLVLPSTRFGRELTVIERLLLIGATAVLADLTHRFIEKPIQLKTFTNKKIIQASLAATLTCTLIGVTILTTSSNKIVLGDGSSVSIAEVLAKPIIYDDGCHVNYGASLSGKCTYGSVDSPRKIVLYGDSHTAQWFPALEKLARENNFALISLTKSACPAADVEREQTGAYKNKECSKWRENSVKRIKELKPLAVILSGFQHLDLPNRYTSRADWWADGQIKTYKALRGASANLIYISDTPHPLKDIPNCLATSLPENCNNIEKSDPTISGGFTKFNPTSLLCKVECSAIVDGVIAYRDASHISIAMSEALSDPLDDFLATKVAGYRRG